ncbi:hypothetical protein ACFSYG_20145 [Leeuwenhoekiella polynyae]|uniref:Uncharacterized protein n=1 Tax=Leeuwenhoekiella polynyae TaxID=1550906 RepID=A0A4Q0PE50_9FLAO|nr:hypothetical protein [Leeuwenhoekiella polynyae]RXG25137.1 hypothetical protein DSM02_1107 [Leeuwenhoekiella polynyae]
MKRLVVYTSSVLLTLAITACNTDAKKQDLAETKTEVKLEKPQPPEEIIPEGYELYKSSKLLNDWKVSLLHPDRASVDATGTQLSIKYSGEDNSFYGGLTDGFIMSMTMMNNEDSEKHINNNTPEKMGDYDVYKYQAPNSIGSAQVDHYLVKITPENDSEAVYADFATAVKGKSTSEYETMIKEIFKSMKWYKTSE